jgi:hypothetical protein
MVFLRKMNGQAVKDRDLLLPGGGGFGSLADAGKSTPMDSATHRPVSSGRKNWISADVRTFLMERPGLDLESLAHLCGRSRGTLQKLIQGKRPITREWQDRFDAIEYRLMDQARFVDNPDARAPVLNEAAPRMREETGTITDSQLSCDSIIRA